MTIPSISYGVYAPTELKIVSLGIGISDDTNNTLNITNDQCLLVGERIQSVSNSPDVKTYGLIVDNRGIAVNTSTQARSSIYNNYAAYLDGDVRVTGNLFIDGTLIGGGSGGGGGSGSSSGLTYWTMVDDSTYNNIYYNENITIGNATDASNNAYKVNIVSSADTNIEHAQFSLQNLQASQLRIGVIGNASNSPIIFNTNSITNGVGGAIEFHVGRDQNYFSNVYHIDAGDYVGGIGQGSIIGTPDYTSYEPPHMMIDYSGNVGVSTSSIDTITFNQRLFQNNAVNFVPVTEAPSLHVEGAMYATNVLMYDYESGAACNVDDLYVRRLGVTFQANQVIPGVFANGLYEFPQNLTVDSNMIIQNNLTIDGTTITDVFVANTAVIDAASFCNDALFNRDMIVNQSIRVRGQIYTEVLESVGTDGTSNYAFQMVQWTPASPVLSNVNLMGQGISTPGRLGAGINPNANQPVHSQFSVYKVDPNIWEMQLFDQSDSKYIAKAGYIGHPSIDPSFRGGYDGSLVIATPAATDRDYSGTFSSFPQHIYFFPGADFSSRAGPFLKGNYPPTLGVFNLPSSTSVNNLHAVGINTYNPVSELDVRGTITFTGDLQYIPQQGSIITLGKWKQEQYTNPLAGAGASLYYSGMSYIADNTNAAHVGINTIPSPVHGLIVSGSFKVNDGLYSADTQGIDRLAGFWLDNRDAGTTNNNVAPSNLATAGGVFTWAGVGVGVKNPTANVEIKDNYNQGTTLKLTKGNMPTNTIIYQGGGSDSWMMQANHVLSRFEIGYGASPFSMDSNVRFMWMRPNPTNWSRPQVVIGADVTVFNAGSSNPNQNAVLTVGGDMSVMGDVNITGRFQINSSTLVNSNVAGATQPVLGQDDVYIGGGNIQLNPDAGKTIVIGTPFSGTINNVDTDKMFRVYAPTNPTSQGIIATFQANSDAALVELVSAKYGQKLIFGTLNPNGQLNGQSLSGTSFAFMNENYQPYITFKTLTNIGVGPNPSSTTNGVGVGIPFSQTPTAMMHLYNETSGANMLRLTKAVISGNTSSDAPQIDFQKTYQPTSGDLTVVSQPPTSWTMKGPDSSYNEKFSMIYTDVNTASSEMFTFASNGCIGIGNTEPEFSIDVINSGNIGAIRLRDTGDAAPHIVFQSGDPNYGADLQRDFRMISSNSGFRFDSQDQRSLFTILDVDSSNHIGIGTNSDSNYDVYLNGIVNIGQSIYLQGVPLFSSGDALSTDGTTIASRNIYLNPHIDPSFQGSLTVNGYLPTGNLFTVNSGNNANMLLLDSTFPEAQVHFRTLMPDGVYSMYRMEMSNTAFLWQFDSNCGNALTVSDSNAGYSNVMWVQPSTRPISVSEFDFTVNGAIVSSSVVNPLFTLGNMGSVGASNGSVYIKTNTMGGAGVGIGTMTPAAALDVYSSNATTALRVDQFGSGDILSLWGSNVSNVFNVSTTGSITGQTLYLGDGSATAPSYSFTSSSNSGLFLDGEGVAISTNGVEQMRVSSHGLVTIGSNAPYGVLTVSSSCNMPMFVVNQPGTADAMRIMNNAAQTTVVVNAAGNMGIGTTAPISGYTLNVQGPMGMTGHLLPTSNITYDLGSSNLRWRDIYLSSGTINLGGTKISQNVDGSVSFTSNAATQRVLVHDVVLGDTGYQVGLQSVTSNIALITQSGTYYPLLTNAKASIVSIGGSSATSNAALNIYASNVSGSTGMPGIIVNQCSTPYNLNSNNDIIRLLANNATVLTVQQGGNVGIGSTLPKAYIDINASNAVGLAVKQSNPASNLATFTGIQSGVVINSLGYVGIGTTIPHSNLHVHGTSLFDGPSSFTTDVNMGADLYVYGNSYVSGNQTAGVMTTNTSDRRLKKDFSKIEDALEKIKTLTGYTYMRTEATDTRRYTGLIAQDVETVLPEAVSLDERTGVLSVAYGNMMGLVVEAIKQLSEHMYELKEKYASIV
jgi:hypothetical protein